ncbi:MAG: MarR family transcriptional regulator [Phototrophicales bacterium]|nr:MAG: MarR family transcriptional regulator [Phototrophicales bacterium]
MGTKYQGTDIERRALNTYIKLHRAAETSLSRTTRLLSDYGLTLSQFAVLEALYHLGAMSQTDLANKLLKSTGNMTSVLKGMEKRDLITRTRSEIDNRYMEVDLTNKGRDLIAGYFPKHVEIIVEDMSILTSEEQDQLAALCRKLGLQE